MNTLNTPMHALAMAREEKESPFRRAAVAGLSRCPKTLPCKYFYDARGARLFERICELDEYYPTRTELAIMQAHAAEMAEVIGPRARVVELGSGEGLKTRLLLDALQAPAAYVPVDISREQLARVAEGLRGGYPGVPVLPVVADYTDALVLPPPPAGTARTVIYFAGSTIGNFEPRDARAFLASMGVVAGRGGGLLLGVDRKKDRATLEAAYDDAQGVTAAFNMNLLVRMNRELGADFHLARFQHRAVWNADAGRVEMHLVSTVAQTVRIGEDAFTFAAGEPIVTEYSYKYLPEEITRLAATAGWREEASWTDDAQRFGVHAFRR